MKENEEKINQMSVQLKRLEKDIKIKNLTINTLWDEINIKDSQILELIKVNLSLLISFRKCKRNFISRSKSEVHYVNLKKENSQLLKEISKITYNYGKLSKENELNKEIIEKLNKKIKLKRK